MAVPGPTHLLGLVARIHTSPGPVLGLLPLPCSCLLHLVLDLESAETPPLVSGFWDSLGGQAGRLGSTSLEYPPLSSGFAKVKTVLCQPAAHPQTPKPKLSFPGYCRGSVIISFFLRK